MTKLLICVAGLPRSGKNTLAGFLRDTYGCTELAIAERLYTEVALAFGVTVEQLKTDEWKRTPQNILATWQANDPDYRVMMKKRGVDMIQPQTSRFHLRHWGTEYRRAIDRFYWMNAMYPALVRGAGEGRIVINDMRRFDMDFTEYTFLREFASQQDMYFLLVNVSRVGSDLWGHSSDDPFPDHLVDLAVENVDGRPQEMCDVTRRYLSEVLGVKK